MTLTQQGDGDRIKAITGEKYIWLRATGSTLISQLIDSFVVLYIAFKLGPDIFGNVSPWTWSQLFAVALVQYAYKFMMAIVLTPVLYAAHHIIEQYLGTALAESMKKKAMHWN